MQNPALVYYSCPKTLFEFLSLHFLTPMGIRQVLWFFLEKGSLYTEGNVLYELVIMSPSLSLQIADHLRIAGVTTRGERGHKPRETFLPINSTGKLKMVKGKSRPLKFKHFLAPFKVFCSRPLQRAQSLETSEFSLITKRVSSSLK